MFSSAVGSVLGLLDAACREPRSSGPNAPDGRACRPNGPGSPFGGIRPAAGQTSGKSGDAVI